MEAKIEDQKPSGVNALPALPERTQIGRIRYSHDAMIDMIIANPKISQGQLAQAFGYSQGWISTVMYTDMFQARLAQRREETVDPEIRATIKERFEGLMHQSLKVLQEKLSKPDVNMIPDKLALRALELGARAQGLGGNASVAPASPPPDHLDKLAQRLVDLQSNIRNDQRTIEAEDAKIVEPKAFNSGSLVGSAVPG